MQFTKFGQTGLTVSRMIPSSGWCSMKSATSSLLSNLRSPPWVCGVLLSCQMHPQRLTEDLMPIGTFSARWLIPPQNLICTN